VPTINTVAYLDPYEVENSGKIRFQLCVEELNGVPLTMIRAKTGHSGKVAVLSETAKLIIPRGMSPSGDVDNYCDAEIAEIVCHNTDAYRLTSILLRGFVVNPDSRNAIMFYRESTLKGKSPHTLKNPIRIYYLAGDNCRYGMNWWASDPDMPQVAETLSSGWISHIMLFGPMFRIPIFDGRQNFREVPSLNIKSEFSP
jgi:hypothetical protein